MHTKLHNPLMHNVASCCTPSCSLLHQLHNPLCCTLLHCYTIAHCSTHTSRNVHLANPTGCYHTDARFSFCIASHYCGKGTTQNRSASSWHLTIGIGFAAQGSTVLIVCAAGYYCGAPQIVCAAVTPCSTETQCAVMLL